MGNDGGDLPGGDATAERARWVEAAVAIWREANGGIWGDDWLERQLAERLAARAGVDLRAELVARGLLDPPQEPKAGGWWRLFG